MRIPFPVHIPLFGVTCFAVILFLFQIFQGTSPTFALCSLLFVVLSAITFNVAGGFSRPSGAYVFFYAVLAVILGLCWKAFLGEPGDSNLLQPIPTIQMYLGSIVAMLGTVFISRKLTVRRPLLANLVTDANIQNATVGCMVSGIVTMTILSVVDIQQGSAWSALAQINRFLPMAVILGVIHEIRVSGGKRSTNLAVLLSGGFIFFIGVISFSKEGMFTPLVCWLMAAASQGYRLSRIQVAGLLLAVFFMFHYLTPYSQYGRIFSQPTFSERIHVAFGLLEDLEGVREKYKQNNADYYEEQSQRYFNTSQGLMDRLQMISRDDALVDITEQRGPIGPLPILMGFENLVPRFLWPGKPAIHFGNLYAHELGGLAEDDVTTGISFSPAGEAYHIGKWFGVFFWAPLIWMMVFVIFDSLCGDTRLEPWGLLICVYFAHLAPEGMLQGAIYSLAYVSFGLLFAAWSAAYVMPILGTLIKGPERVTTRRIAPVRSIPRRARSVPPQEAS